jgi:predicted ATPase/DNA-binding winged helix-turn-helix (wHTH) protein
MLYLFGDYELDTRLYELRHGGRPCKLEPQVFNVLAYLLQHHDRVVTKDELLEQLWPNQFISEVTLNHRIMAARKVIGDSGRAQRCIKTVHGRGYRFIAEVTLSEQSHAAPMRSARTPTTADTSARPAALPQRPPWPFVARETELRQMQQCLTTAFSGMRQVAFIIGEAGIGKTTLVDTFVAQVLPADVVWIGRGQCIEQYGAGEAYLPLLEALGQLGRGPDGPGLVELLRQQAPHWLLQMPALLSSAEQEAIQRRCADTTRARMLRELAEAIETLTTERLLVLVLEDLHWSDDATLDWLALVARRRGVARLLVLGTYRPADALTRVHPVHTVVQELQRQGQATVLSLTYLAETDVAAYLAQRFGTVRFPAELVSLLHQHTTGNPFFLVTAVEELIGQQVLVPLAEGWTLSGKLGTVGIPESVRQLIEQQLARLSTEAGEILVAASVAGREFAAAAVAASLGQTTEQIEACCDMLARRGQFIRPQGVTIWPDGTVTARYGFIHDLYHEVLYTRIPASRLVRWHRQIGARLEAGYGPRAREMAAELAMHFARGRDAPRAVVYLHHAADKALRRYANREAIDHLTQALAWLKTLPHAPEHLQQELALLTALGPALVAVQGYGSLDVEHTYLRARELCQQTGDALQLSQVLWGLATCYLVRAEHQTARDLGEQLLALAQRQQDTGLLCVGHFALGAALYCLGAFAPAHEHLAQSIALDDPQQSQTHPFLFGMDVGVFCRSWAAHALWHLGYPDQARMMSDTALARARVLAHPFSLALALNYAAICHQFCREERATSERAAAATVLCREHGFGYYLAWGPILQGWVGVAQGQGEAGITQMQDGLAAFQATGGKVRLPYYLALLAEACRHTGQNAAGLTLIADALAQAAATGEGWWQAELYRLQGELLVHEGGTHAVREAEECVRLALTVARRQQAKSLELRVAMSLARLWQRQGRRSAAYGLLAPMYNWFTEGFDTPDLQEAKALLEELAG